MTRAEITFSSCALAVRDLDEALGFSRDVLGFEVRADADLQGRRVSVGPPSQPEVWILLQFPGADPVISPADRRAIVDLAASSLLGRLVFVTDDCDAAFEHIEAAGAEVVQEPIDRPDDVRDCAFLDPSGDILRFTQSRQVNRRRAAGQAHAATDPRAS
ncbi:VOC family protein [Actinomadura sp. NEAU-AAG7]|uniref:VOC family protein n=1 Tax=Actinomadura sp. NEAU-AAG7 TaxID=2839640 RepID=UPI001BE4B04E|nr:VOC family protein [Actinomadura sp. NEAU-AAG7]MBT2213192.1 VOC family protein [Actinomadura sp. NEAU-AAG7]